MENTNNENKKIVLKDFWESMPKDEKAKLKKIFQLNGLCQASVYRRFSYMGFHLWEYEGITSILNEYGVTIPRDKRKLWNSIKNKEEFYKFMYEKGMSRPTVNYRFRSYNFKRFEIIGVKEIIDEFHENPDKEYKRIYRKKKKSFTNLKNKRASD